MWTSRDAGAQRVEGSGFAVSVFCFVNEYRTLHFTPALRSVPVGRGFRSEVKTRDGGSLLWAVGRTSEKGRCQHSENFQWQFKGPFKIFFCFIEVEFISHAIPLFKVYTQFSGFLTFHD